MAAADWNWRHPIDQQDYPWDCAAASLAWALTAWGYSISEQEVIAGLGPARISPYLGLLDATGSGLVAYLGELGIPAANNPYSTWADVQAAAGHQPLIMGGRDWCHWTGVRMGTTTAGIVAVSALALANPAAGWMGISQSMLEQDFDTLGAFAAVWFPA